MKKITLLIFVFLISACTKPITDDEITSIKLEIKNYYTNKGFEEIKVNLVRESDFKLTGNTSFRKYYIVQQPKPNFESAFADIFITALNGPQKEKKAPEKRFNEYLVECNATMDSKTRKGVWTCK